MSVSVKKKPIERNWKFKGKYDLIEKFEFFNNPSRKKGKNCKQMDKNFFSII